MLEMRKRADEMKMIFIYEEREMGLRWRRDDEEERERERRSEVEGRRRRLEVDGLDGRMRELAAEQLVNSGAAFLR